VSMAFRCDEHQRGHCQRIHAHQRAARRCRKLYRRADEHWRLHHQLSRRPRDQHCSVHLRAAAERRRQVDQQRHLHRHRRRLPPPPPAPPAPCTTGHYKTPPSGGAAASPPPPPTAHTNDVEIYPVLAPNVAGPLPTTNPALPLTPPQPSQFQLVSLLPDGTLK